MANKKILKEEILSDEQLDNVAGGTAHEMVKDSEFLHAVGLLERSYSLAEVKANEEEISLALNEAFGKVNMYVEAGLNFINHYGGDSSYGELGRAEAYKEVCDKIKPGFDYKKYL